MEISREFAGHLCFWGQRYYTLKALKLKEIIKWTSFYREGEVCSTANLDTPSVVQAALTPEQSANCFYPTGMQQNQLVHFALTEPEKLWIVGNGNLIKAMIEAGFDQSTYVTMWIWLDGGSLDADFEACKAPIIQTTTPVFTVASVEVDPILHTAQQLCLAYNCNQRQTKRMLDKKSPISSFYGTALLGKAFNVESGRLIDLLKQCGGDLNKLPYSNTVIWRELQYGDGITQLRNMRMVPDSFPVFVHKYFGDKIPQHLIQIFGKESFSGS